MGRRTRTWIAALLGGAAALLIAAAASAHGPGLAGRTEVLAQALGVGADEVEQARADGSLRAMLAGVTLGELAQARTDASNAAIDAALAGGSITQAQADRLRELAADDGGRPGGFDRAAKEELRGLRGAVRIDRAAVLADALGLGADEYEAARADGSLRERIAAARVAVAAALVDARDAAIDTALADGSITEAQAELLRGAGHAIGGGCGHGRGGGHGRSGGSWRGGSWGGGLFGGGRI